MGDGIDFKSDIYLSRCSFTTSYDVQDKIDSNKADIDSLATKLKMFAIASVGEIIPTEWEEEPVNWVDSQMQQLLEQYDELLIKNYNLSLYLEYLEDQLKKEETVQ